jgi:ABC-type tungstate transport system substrate-binding protein
LRLEFDFSEVLIVRQQSKVRSICARSMAASGASNEIAMRISVSLALALEERANRTAFG